MILVSYYIGKVQSEEPSLYIHSFHPIYDKIINKSALQFKGNFNVTTKYYTNECLKFIEGIMLLGGNEIDLTLYDELLTMYELQNQELLKKQARANRKGKK